MSSWSLKEHQFCNVQYILQCHGELSSCPLSDLRKYRAHHSLLVRFQRNLVWRRHLPATYNDSSIPCPIFLPPETPNGAKITGCFSQGWEEEGGTYRPILATHQGLVAGKTFFKRSSGFLCTFMCHGLHLVSAGSAIINSVRKQSFSMWPQFQDAFWIANRFPAT